jgi:hypothetical protein
VIRFPSHGLDSEGSSSLFDSQDNHPRINYFSGRGNRRLSAKSRRSSPSGLIFGSSGGSERNFRPDASRSAVVI